MTDTFHDKLNEDIRGAFRKLGSAMAARGRSAGANARTKFWAALGDAKAEGQLDFEFMMKDLRDHYEYYCGQMQYDQTAKSLIDFMGVLSQKPEFDTKQLMAMMGGRADPLSMRSPDEGEIDEAFEAISNKQVQGPEIPELVVKIETWAKNPQNKALIFEYMRTIVQNMPEMLERAEWARLLPFVDRYLSDQELNRHLTTIAKNMLRSRAVQDYAPEDGAKSGNDSTDPQDAPEDGEKSTSNRNFAQPITLPESGSKATRDEIKGRLDELRFNDSVRKKVFIEGIAMTPGQARNFFTDENLTGVAANVLAWIVSLNGLNETEVAMNGIIPAAAEAGFVYPPNLARALYTYLLRGGDIKGVIEEFDHFLNNQDRRSVFVSELLKYAIQVIAATKGKQPEGEDDDSN